MIQKSAQQHRVPLFRSQSFQRAINFGCEPLFQMGPGGGQLAGKEQNGPQGVVGLEQEVRVLDALGQAEELLAQLTGQVLAAGEIVALQGESLRRYEVRLARALASVINVLDPDVIVLGGGMSNAGHLYTEVPRLWSRYAFSDHVATRLARNAHGDSSGVRGAAWLWP